MSRRYDSLVIGAGIVGSCAAWQLAKKGQKVLLLEQFHLPSTRGSSHGQSRLIRSCYTERHFAALMPDAFALWKEIEKATGITLIQNTKVLFVSSEKEIFDATKRNVEEFCPKSLRSVNLKEYPNSECMKFPADYNGFLDTFGGVIYAHKAVTAIQALFESLGGEINDGCPVTSVENVGDDVSVTTTRGIVLAQSLVVCTGAWSYKLFDEETNQLLRRVTTPIAEKVYYWKKISGDQEDIPSFYDYSSTTHIYGLASDEYPGIMKVCAHLGGAPCDPDERDKAKFIAENEENLKQYIKDNLPMLEPTPAVIEKCMYTMSKDENFIISRIPAYRNVYLACAFCGSGFKTAPVIGKLLSEMALDLPPSHDVNQFALSRFS